jgi:hypothetical protein
MPSMWEALSPQERRHAKKVFAIPKPIKKQYLPQRHLSLLNLLTFKFPSLDFTDPPHSDLSQLFSKDSPTLTDTAAAQYVLNATILPPNSIIRTLQNTAREAYAIGNQSIILASLGDRSGEAVIRLPLWTVTLLNWILEHRLTVRGPWTRVSSNLQKLAKKKSSPKAMNRADLASHVLGQLATIPWRLEKLGFEDSNPFHTLHRLLDSKWTSSTIEENLLQVLEHSLMQQFGWNDKFVVHLSVNFVDQLIEAMENPSQYASDSRYKWLRTYGEQVFDKGMIVLTILHLGNIPNSVHERDGTPHWVPLVIDGQDSCYRYGDSLKKNATLPPKLRQALDA